MAGIIFSTNRLPMVVLLLLFRCCSCCCCVHGDLCTHSAADAASVHPASFRPHPPLLCLLSHCSRHSMWRTAETAQQAGTAAHIPSPLLPMSLLLPLTCNTSCKNSATFSKSASTKPREVIAGVPVGRHTTRRGLHTVLRMVNRFKSNSLTTTPST